MSQVQCVPGVAIRCSAGGERSARTMSRSAVNETRRSSTRGIARSRKAGTSSADGAADAICNEKTSARRAAGTATAMWSSVGMQWVGARALRRIHPRRTCAILAAHVRHARVRPHRRAAVPSLMSDRRRRRATPPSAAPPTLSAVRHADEPCWQCCTHAARTTQSVVEQVNAGRGEGLAVRQAVGGEVGVSAARGT